MNKPILTIGIPTYNHGHFLKECLAAITDQFADRNIFDQVEVFISDNASEDDTRQVVEAYQKRFSNIRYSRSEKNLEFDRNVDAVLRNARGAFCWTLSSNEYIVPGSIASVLSVIRQHREVAYICVSNQKEDRNAMIRSFADGNQWLKEMSVFGGQISQCIFNMRYMITDRAKYFDTFWPHLALFWEIVVHRPIILMPCLFKIPDTYEHCSWAKEGHALMTYIRLKQVVADLPRYGYDRNIVNGVILDLAKGLPRTVASAKINGLPAVWSHLSLLAGEFYRYPLYLFLSIGIFFTPTILLRTVKNIK